MKIMTVLSKAPSTNKKGKHIKSTVFQVPAIANMKLYWKKWKFTITKNYNDKTKDARENSHQMWKTYINIIY